MKIVEKEVKLGLENLILTNQRAMFWPKEKSLILSDLHLGKTAHFRKHGIALPSNLINVDLQRLSNLINHFSAQKLIIVGDFLHAGKNSEFETFKNWKSQFKTLQIELIKGNHDRISNEYFKDLGILNIHSILKMDTLLFSHEEVVVDKAFVISGHIHPGACIKMTTRNTIKLPCYVVDQNQLILPAFSSFTGLDTKDYFPNSKKYVFNDDFIMEL
ncbi:ligase-associated DNA damage response endonuclease PdeM [Faecalibacter bovis]|uniref:Ligase-associated DNA damage response endonuclease PdeM n=1 Tax=Faecalibacter bovis TaxID=2898187 RepID=A0ABX7XC93_9FLAO|nr:ligase-associated DNA damage response endonuclease PdeM [Faecalibacter bovis]QTV05517.1 ligase-associated DNA damage response endonuclease PdeM [Faecalibacter bovis]